MSTVTLSISLPDGRREVRQLPIGTFRIGRDAGELVFADPNLSAVHAELRVGPDGVEIADLGSTNGTFDANGQRLQGAYRLEPHRPVRVASTTIVLLGTAQPVHGGTAVMPQFPANPPGLSAAAVAPPRAPGVAPARGTVIKVPDQTPGLVFVNGGQLPFVVQGVWRSPTAPTLNQVVDVELDAAGNVRGLTAIDGQQLALERLNQLGDNAQAQAKKALGAVKSNSKLVVVGAAAAGMLLLVAGVATALGMGRDLSKGSLADKIDEKLSQEPVCWALQNMPKDLPVAVEPTLAGGALENPIVAGLVKGGYVTAAQETQHQGTLLGRFAPTVVALTEKGRDAKVWDRANGFCVGRREVDEVLRWTEPAEHGGAQAIRIEYTWKLANTPSWVSEELFASVEGLTAPVEGMAVAQKKSDGWQIVMP